MSNHSQSITGHMVVKNEDRWVWYAIMSILNRVEKLLIWDTGSTDKTVSIVKSINSPKICLRQSKEVSRVEIVEIRNQQIAATKSDWIWIIDGDEIYQTRTSEEIIKLTKHKDLMAIVVKRVDLLGDIYHYQSDQKVGSYQIFGKSGHYNLRLIKNKPTLMVRGSYPNEGYYLNNRPILSLPPNKVAFTASGYFHATYLKRSSLGTNLSNTFFRNKYKLELGKAVAINSVPEVLFSKAPKGIYQPQRRSVMYLMWASLITPIKIWKRKVGL